jgi:hypothetical protein
MAAELEDIFYMVDACSFTELRRVYPKVNFPGVWELIEGLVVEGRLNSVEDVFFELDAQDDEVSVWARSHRDIFLPLTEEIQQKAREILSSHPTLVDLKKRKSSADPFLIAAALLRGATVVTQEKRSGGPPAVKIPDVCASFNVRCIPLLTMLQAENLRG